MTPSPYKIFCIGIIWFIYTIMTFINFIKLKIKLIINFIHLCFISLFYNSEKDYFEHINKSKTLKYPTNLAIVLNKFLINEENIISALCQFIRWIILTNKIKYLTIYDAFDLISVQKLLEQLTEKVIKNENIQGKINIHISYNESKNNKNFEKHLQIDKKSKNLKEIQFYICIISFKEANDNLINKIVKEKNAKIYGNYPDVYKWFNNKNDNNSNNEKITKEFEKYLTRKNEESLPELVITFGKNKYLFYEDICLYGFPFTLLENSEIINVNHKQFDQLDLLDFFDIFNKNSKIIKRFGK